MDATIVLAAGGGLASAIALLFKIIMKQNKDRMEDASSRSSDHSSLSERVGKLEGEKHGIEMLSRKTLDAVHDAIVERDSYDT